MHHFYQETSPYLFFTYRQIWFVQFSGDKLFVCTYTASMSLYINARNVDISNDFANMDWFLDKYWWDHICLKNGQINIFAEAMHICERK